MRCKKAEKWISDWMDGVLSARREGILRSHLARCRSCSEYARQVRLLKEETEALYAGAAGAFDGEAFSARLRSNLVRQKRGEGKISSSPGKPAWRWAAAATSLLLLLSIQLLFPPSRYEETWANLYPNSYEGTLSEITRELQLDRGLEDVFNSLILTSIEEELDGEEMDYYGGYPWRSLLMEELSEEDLKWLEKELKKDITS
jgi:hypothetical protein